MSGVERGGEGGRGRIWNSGSRRRAVVYVVGGGKAERLPVNEALQGLIKTKDFPLRKDGVQSHWAD